MGDSSSNSRGKVSVCTCVCVCVCFMAGGEEQSELWEMSGNLVRMECQGYRGYRGIQEVSSIPPYRHTHTCTCTLSNSSQPLS